MKYTVYLSHDFYGSSALPARNVVNLAYIGNADRKVQLFTTPLPFVGHSRWNLGQFEAYP